MNQGLKKLRKEINKADSKVLQLLNQRTKLALLAGKLKVAQRKNIYSPEREEEVYRTLVKLNRGPLSKESIKAIYREIMSGAIGLQKKLVIAYLGPEATFTHEAARNKFGASVKYLAAGSIGEIFNAVEKGYADYGVVPVENSIEGAVTHTLDMFMDSDLKVCSEIMLEISHNLLSKEKDLKNVKKVYSNPQVFGQCRLWLKTNLGNIPFIEVESTAKAAMVAAREKNSSAIASSLAAKLYGLHTISEDIEDVPHNVTRFLVISNRSAEPTKKDKTSILFSIKDRVGALHDSLRVFKRNGVNLTKIESRPSKKKVWQYYFFLDFNGHCKDKKVKKALKELGEYCIFVKILGSYPKIT